MPNLPKASNTIVRLTAAALAGCIATSAMAQAPLADYEAGRSRELTLTLAAISLIACAPSAEQRAIAAYAAEPDHIQAEAAHFAGLRVAEYRVLIAQVDSQLIRLPQGEAIRGLTVSASRRLDSLRVALLVARARVNAMAEMPFDARQRRGRAGC